MSQYFRTMHSNLLVQTTGIFANIDKWQQSVLSMDGALTELSLELLARLAELFM